MSHDLEFFPQTKVLGNEWLENIPTHWDVNLRTADDRQKTRLAAGDIGAEQLAPVPR